MASCCSLTKQKPDLKQCILIFIVGVVFMLVGVPMMIAGIVGGFAKSDLIGYIGGTSIFFGILFLFLWYMLTIPALEKKKDNWENSDNIVEATNVEIAALSAGKTIGLSNLAFERDLPGAMNSSDDVIMSDVSTQSSQRDLPAVNADIVIEENSNNSNNQYAFQNHGYEPDNSENGIVSSISGNIVSYNAGQAT
uniref:Uncharacterized LOC100181331 n=1 Tax=Ciona intestinalis TaxID=7719 RepID=H2XU18_CIOIN|nr:uncharacterized protein LOC100181331 [Ciona intestinalis]|eukprot:XP_018670687.1 uncharacterized protein LOC100181331 [Ciona intestinalis]